MSYLDVIGPGPWLQDEYLMDESTFLLITGIMLFCFIAIAVAVVVLLVVMWKRRHNAKNEPTSDLDSSETEEPK